MTAIEREELRKTVVTEMACGLSDDVLRKKYLSRFTSFNGCSRFINFTRDHFDQLWPFWRMQAWPCFRCGAAFVMRQWVSSRTVCEACRTQLEITYEEKIEEKRRRAVFRRLAAEINEVKCLMRTAKELIHENNE